MENFNHTPVFRLTVATTEGTFYFQPQEIVRLEANSNYTFIHFTNRAKLFTARVLKDFAAHLEPIGFIRTHRTHLVNPAYITYISPDGKVKMKDESVAEISRRKRTEVMGKLSA